MIQKITSNEYLKRVDNMTAVEREGYQKRVGEWLKKQAPLLLPKVNDEMARFQNVLQCSIGWNDQECQAWTEGARLLTAITGKADTWLPDMLYVKAARRAMRHIAECFGEVVQGSGFNAHKCDHEPHADAAPAGRRCGTGSIKRVDEIKVQGQPAGKPTGTVATQQTKQATKEEPAVGTAKATQTVAADKQVASGRNNDITKCRNNDKENAALVTAVPARPKHIDQYVHLLPQKTQERAAEVRGLLRDLDAAREKMRLLMNDPQASADSRAAWAKTATKLDEKVKAIYKELDQEWEKLVASGRIAVDDLGNAHVLPDADATEAVAAERNTGIPGLRNNDEEEAAKAKRKEYLKKWLRDTRTAVSDERRKQWEKNCKELLKLGGEITDSIRKAGEVYGVDIVKLKETEGDK